MAERRQVLDASALLCLLFDEPGADRVEASLAQACISSANLAEVIAKLVDRGVDTDQLVADLRDLDLAVVSLDRAQAEMAGMLRGATRGAGLSLGDRCCLALAAAVGGTAMTTDPAWIGLVPDIDVELVR